MEEFNRQTVLGRLGKAKRKRVAQEISYVKHLRLRYPHYQTVVEKVIGVLTGKEKGSIGSYIRPYRT